MYLDSAILVKLVVREPDSAFYADLVDGQVAVSTSELVVAECRSALLRKQALGEISSRVGRAAWSRLEGFWNPGGGLRLHPVSRSVLQEAGAVMERCIPRAPVRTLDAIHAATCLLTRAYPLVTNDRILRAAAEILALPLSPLPGA